MGKMHKCKIILFGIGYLIIGIILFAGCTSLSQQQRKKNEADKLTQSIKHFELGLALEQAGKPDEAIGEYNKSIELSPRPIVYYHLGLIYAAKADYPTAIANFDKAIAFVPTFDAAIKERDRIKSSLH